MNMWTAIVAIVAIGCIAEVLKNRYKQKQSISENDGQTEGRINDLERRVESLESIIIDLEKDQKYRDLS